MSSLGIFSLKQPPTVTSHAHTALVRKIRRTWTLDSSKKSSTNRACMAQGHSHFTYSESPSYIPGFLMVSSTLKRRTENIQSFLRQMEPFLINSQTDSWSVELTKSSGHGDEITLRLIPLKSLEGLGKLDFLSKKPQKKSLRSGRSSLGLR